MAVNFKRMTFIATPEIESLLKQFKKEVFYDRSRSDMIRELLAAGMRALETEEAGKEDKNGQSA